MQRALTNTNGQQELKRDAESIEKYTVCWNLLQKKIDLYMDRLKELESRCSDPTAESENLLEEITHLNNSILQACAEFEASVNFDKSIIKRAQLEFRSKTHSILSKSYFINHARTWPRGYQGDYIMIEGVYQNTPMTRGIGYYLDIYSLSTTLAKAVRERRVALQLLLKRELEERTCPKVLDIACGSCREIIELADELKKSQARFVCLDYDPNALEFAANRIRLAGLSTEQVQLRQYNAIKMVNYERNLREFGVQDIIYSIGFFDYLTDNVLTRLLPSLYQLINPGGKLILCFKDCTKYDTSYYHWMVDWNGFFQRTPEDCKKLLREAHLPPESTTFRDHTGTILFFVISK